MSHTHILLMCKMIANVCITDCVSCDQALLASEFSAVTPLPITLSSLTACVYVCVSVCVHTAPGVQ